MVLLNVIFLMVFVSWTSGFCVYDDLGAGQMSGFKNWLAVVLNEDHSNRQPNQQPKEWTNFTFDIPDNRSTVQLTASKSLGRSNVTEEVPVYVLSNLAGTLQVSLSWWGKPWTLYVGWR